MHKNKLEATKILAKVMQSSYKRKELGEIIVRIVNKLEGLLESPRLTQEYAELKREYLEIMKEVGPILDREE